MSSIVDAFRLATAEQHKALEATTGLPESLRSRSDLVLRLKQMYGFYRELDPVLSSHALWNELDLPQCRQGKLSRLVADLDALGIDRSALAALPVCRDHPPLTRMTALGTGYVIEGATLGGRVMRNHVARQREADTMNGALSFYDGYGEATGPHWRAFMSAVNALSLDSADTDAAVTAAQDTFGRLHRWLGGDVPACATHG